jgi:5-methylcytosine-specific restriction endonuclease McrA
LLNSTPAGTVISDRQLYRHRERGNHKFVTGKRIDFFRYVAWLISQRHGRLLHGTYARVRWQVTANEVLDLLDRQAYRCALTGRQLMPDTAALDHVIPVSRGGEHRIENAQVLQKAVNRAKGTLTNEEFIALCHEVVAHANRFRKPE